MKQDPKNQKINRNGGKKPTKPKKKKNVMKSDERIMTWLLLIALAILVVAITSVVIYSAVVDRDTDPQSSASSSSETGIDKTKEDFRIGNIGYTLTENDEVQVYFYYNKSNEIGIDLTIPETVEHDGKRYTVASLSDHAFLEASPALVVIPKSIRSIGVECFGDTQNISIVYLGTPEDWAKIDMDADMNAGWLDSASITFDE